MRLLHIFLFLIIVNYSYSCAQCIISPFDTAQGGLLGDLIISSYSNVLSNSTTQSGSTATPPSGLSISNGNAMNVLSWNPVSDTTAYNLYWSNTSSVSVSTGTRILNVTSPYSHTGLLNGTTYYYILTSVDSRGEGSASELISATPLSPVAVGSAGTVYYTLDGLTWTAKTIAGTNVLYKVIHDGTNYIAVGGTGTACVAYYSYDGISWTQSTGFTCNSQMNDITFGKGILVAAGGTTILSPTATTYISTNHGITFTVNSGMNASGAAYTRIAFDGTYFIAGNGANPPSVYRSLTGTAFTTAPVSALFGSACTSSGYMGDLYNIPGTARLIFIGAASGCSNATVTSHFTDNSGNNWTNNSSSIFGGNTTPISPNGIAFGGTRLVAVGQSCKTDYSDNSLSSLSWNYNGTMSGCTTGTIWNGITFDKSKFIAVGVNGSGVGTIATSATGLPTSWNILNVSGGSINGVSWK